MHVYPWSMRLTDGPYLLSFNLKHGPSQGWRRGEFSSLVSPDVSNTVGILPFYLFIRCVVQNLGLSEKY